jgi:hypothetical protein
VEEDLNYAVLNILQGGNKLSSGEIIRQELALFEKVFILRNETIELIHSLLIMIYIYMILCDVSV